MSNASTYSGDTTINDGTLTVTETLSDSTDVIVASGATYDVDEMICKIYRSKCKCSIK